MRLRQNRPIAGESKNTEITAFGPMFPKVISKRVDFLPTHDPQVALFPTFAWNSDHVIDKAVPRLVSIDKRLAEIQPLNQYFSNS